MIKVFITDVDGTLFDHDSMSIPQANIDAIRLLQEKGVKIVIATARTHASSLSIIEALQMRKYGGYLIDSNGASIYDLTSDRLIYQKPIPMAWIRDLYEYSLKNGLHFTAEQEEYVVVSGYDTGTKIDNLIVGVDFILVSPHNDFMKRIKTEPFKVSFTQEKELIDKYFPLVEEKYSDRFYVCHAGDNFIDIVLKDVNKSTAVAELLKLINCDFDDIAAIGDGDNDSWLLAKAKYSASLANGTSKAKKAGKILVKSCDEAGLSEFIHILLKHA